MSEHQESLLDDLLGCEAGLSAREMEFIEDMDNRWRQRELTDATVRL